MSLAPITPPCWGFDGQGLTLDEAIVHWGTCSMRLLPSLSTALLILAGAPAVAEAANTPCGFLNGQYDVAGKSYRGQLIWPADPMGLDGPVPARTVNAEASFGANCIVTWKMEGRSFEGRWMQKNEAILFDVDAFGFTGFVAADGALKGDAINDPGDLGQVSMKPAAR